MKKSKSITLLFTFIVPFVAANSQAAQKNYNLVGAAPTGTLLRSTDLTSSIPLDKRYYELDQEERNRVRGRFSGLSDNQTPPFPVHGMEAIYKPIISEHKKRAKSGTLSLVAIVNEQGRVERLSVSDSPSKRMAEVSRAVVSKTQFDPAFCSGEPCKMEFPIEIKFQ